MPSRSGLPDEAVEAMARVAYERAYPQGERESWESWSERVPWAAAHFRESVLAIVAALPADVYVSDGQGHVKLTDALRKIAEYDVAAAYGHEDEWTTAEAFEVVQAIARAALSATDTERACDCGAVEGKFFTSHPSGHAVTCATRAATDTEKVGDGTE